MNRTHLISDVQVEMIRTELRNLRWNVIHTPDTDTSYKNIVETLDRIQGA